MEENKGRKTIHFKRIWLLALFPISILFLGLSKQSVYIAEKIFARGVFSFISQTIVLFTGWLPFSLAEIIVVAGPIAVILYLLVKIYLLLKRRKSTGDWKKIIEWNRNNKRNICGNAALTALRQHLGKLVLHLLCMASVLFFLYTILCGTNYYRESIGVSLGFTIVPSTKEELYGLCMELTKRTNEARDQLSFESFTKENTYQLSMSKKELGEEARLAYRKAGEVHEIFAGNYPPPKRLLFSRAMSYMGLTGIYMPFTMEANVNTDVPEYSLASTMCHELAHLHGFMREDEANYIAYYITTNSDNEELVYSGLMEALILAGNALYHQDKELFYKVREAYSDGVALDLYHNSLYWQQFEDSVASETVNKINDTYLKANNQIDGVKSYGRMVDLLLAEYRKKQL